jgi:hypothetical protein
MLSYILLTHIHNFFGWLFNDAVSMENTWCQRVDPTPIFLGGTEESSENRQ